MLVEGDKAKKDEEWAIVGLYDDVEGSPIAYVKEDVGGEYVVAKKRVRCGEEDRKEVFSSDNKRTL